MSKIIHSQFPVGVGFAFRRSADYPTSGNGNPFAGLKLSTLNEEQKKRAKQAASGVLVGTGWAAVKAFRAPKTVLPPLETSLEEFSTRTWHALREANHALEHAGDDHVAGVLARKRFFFGNLAGYETPDPSHPGWLNTAHPEIRNALRDRYGQEHFINITPKELATTTQDNLKFSRVPNTHYGRSHGFEITNRFVPHLEQGQKLVPTLWRPGDPWDFGEQIDFVDYVKEPRQELDRIRESQAVARSVRETDLTAAKDVFKSTHGHSIRYLEIPHSEGAVWKDFGPPQYVKSPVEFDDLDAPNRYFTDITEEAARLNRKYKPIQAALQEQHRLIPLYHYERAPFYKKPALKQFWKGGGASKWFGTGLALFGTAVTLNELRKAAQQDGKAVGASYAFGRNFMIAGASALGSMAIPVATLVTPGGKLKTFVASAVFGAVGSTLFAKGAELVSDNQAVWRQNLSAWSVKKQAVV